MKEQEAKTSRSSRFAPETLSVRVVAWLFFITFSLLLIGLVARGVVTGLAGPPAAQSPRSSPESR